MAAIKRPTARGPQTPAFDFRVKAGEFEWGGMYPDGDAAAAGESRPRLILNADFRGGAIQNRAGQEKLNVTALTSGAAINGVFDFRLGTPKRLYFTTIGMAGYSAGAGFSVSFYDSDFRSSLASGNLSLAPFVYYSAGVYPLQIAPYSPDLYVGQDALLRKMVPIVPEWEQDPIVLAGPSLDIPVFDFSVPALGYTRIVALAPFDGQLFVAVLGAGACDVYRWNGQTMVWDLSGLVVANPPTRMDAFREKLILGFGGTPNNIKTRPLGAAFNAWATVSPNAGTVSFKRGAPYKNKYYITTGGQDIFVYDDDAGTLTQIPIGTSGLPANAITYGAASAFGFLFIAYTLNGNVGGKLARYDGTTWVPAHKSFVAQFANNTVAGPLFLFRGNLVCACLESAAGGVLYFSPGSNTTGTWNRVVPATALSGQSTDGVVF